MIKMIVKIGGKHMVNNAFAQMDLFTYFSSQKITHLPGEFLSEKDVGEELSFEELSKKRRECCGC